MKASEKFTDLSCSRGFTLTAIWRGSRYDVCPGCLDVFINGILLESINYPGLASDFFMQFVNNDPVSIDAKRAILEAYANVLMSA